MPLEQTGFLGGFWCEGGRELLCRQAPSELLWEASSAWPGVSGRGLSLPFLWSGSSELSEAGRGSWLGMKLASNLLLVIGLVSVIFPQIFNQEKVRQEKIRQDRKKSKTIQEIVTADVATSSILV